MKKLFIVAALALLGVAMLQLPAGAAVSITASDGSFSVASVLNLTCNATSNITWSADCPAGKNCFAYFNNYDSKIISTLNRQSVPVLTRVDNGYYRCEDQHSNDTNQIQVEVKGIGVYDSITMSPVPNNSYFVADVSDLINSELHCIGANGSGMWYFKEMEIVENNHEVFTTVTAYGSTKLYQLTDEISLEGSGYGSGSGSGLEDNDTTTSLKVSFIDPGLEGYYECRAVDEDGTMGVIRVGLFINGRAIPEVESVNALDNDPVVAVGTNVTLSCNINSMGVPTGNISWYHNGKYITNEMKPELTIYVANDSFYGNYSCIVSNIVGSDMASLDLEQELVAPSVSTDQDVYIARVNETLTITCNASGIPTPDLYFMISGEISNDTYKQTFTADRYGSSNATLEIVRLGLAYTGQHSCVARNSLKTVITYFNITVQYSPTVEPVVDSVTVNYTQQQTHNVSLTCTSDGEPVPVIQWYFGQDPINTTDTKYSFMTTEYTSKLFIDDIVPVDAGEYICNASNDIGHSSGSVNVTVNALPIATTDKDHYIGIEHQSLNITCTATGVPAPSMINWYQLHEMSGEPRFINDHFNEVDFVNSSVTTLSNGLYEISETMVINPINTSYTGQYYCVASNQLGESPEAQFNITVQYAPMVTVNESITLIYLQDRDVSLTCTSDGEPVPVIQWYFGQDPINTTDTKYSFMTTEYTSKLFIDDIVPVDAGEYICNASNDIGHSSGSVNVTVNALPIATTDEDHYIGIEYRSLNITCTATGVPAPSMINWYQLDEMSGEPRFINDHFNEVDFVNSSVTTLSNGLYEISETMVINPINTSYTGQYYCVASNQLGESPEAQFNITVQFIPNVTESVPDKTVIVPQQSSVSLDCSFVGEPTPQIQWLYNNEPITSDRVSITTTNTSHHDGDGVLSISELVLTNITIFDTGLYSCNGSNIIGYTVSDGNLLVAVQPHVTQLSSNDSLIIQPDSVLLTCVVMEGYPSTSIQWYTSSGTDVNNRDKYLIEENSYHSSLFDGLNFTNSSLTILDMDPFDADTYACNASNFAGDDVNSIGLTVNVKPQAMVDSLILVANEYSNASFSCYSTGIPVPNITWFRNGSMISNGIQATPSSLSSSTLLYEYNETLMINNVMVSDNGSYSCAVENSVGSVDIELQLIVHYGTRLIQGIENMTINEHDTLNLSCQVEGRPHPSITWWFSTDGAQFDQLNDGTTEVTTGQLVTSTIMIMDTLREYNGYFKCNSSNTLNTVEAVAFITVNFVTDVLTGPVSQTVVSPNSVTFTCQAEGRPLPSLKWFKETTQLSTDSTYTIATMAQQETLISSSLTINSTIPLSEGVYTCGVENILLNDSADATLTVHVIPEVKLANPVDGGTQFIVNQSYPVNISCSSEGLPRPSLTWYKGDTLLSSDLLSASVEDTTILSTGTVHRREQTFIITSAQVSDTSSYRCTGSNVAGQDTVNFTVFVQVRPKITAVDGDRHIISVEATSTDLHFIIDDAIPDVSPDGISWYFSTSFTELSPDDASDITDITGDKAPSRYTYSADARSLTISNMNQTDEGRFYIVASNPAGIDFNHIDIIVYGPPRFVRKPEDNTIINGNHVTFVCEGVADPVHDVLWTFNGTPIISTLVDIVSVKYSLQSDPNQYTTYGSLTISNVQYIDQGTYACILNNTVDTISATVNLQVYVTPVIHEVSASVDINITNSLTLYCVVVGFPVPNFNWYKDGTLINPLEEEGITDNTQKYTPGLSGLDHLSGITYISQIGYVGTLQFSSIARKDTGNYTCSTNNQPHTDGTDTSDTITVTVLERPDPPINVYVNETSVTSRDLMLSWQPSFDGNRDITSYEVYKRVYSSNTVYERVYPTAYTTMYRVDPLEPYTKYEFKVLACNEIGCTNMDDATPTDPIRTLTDVPETPPRSCFAEAHNSTTLIITWTEPVKPNGLMEYYTINYTSVESSVTDLCTVHDDNVITTNDNDTTLMLGNLQKGVKYSLNITAYTSVGAGPPSTDSCQYSTAYDVPEVTPAITHISSPSSTSLSLSWSLSTNGNAPCKWNGPILGYQVTYSATNGGSQLNTIELTNSTIVKDYIISDLNKFTKYTVNVRMVNVEGYGEYSTVTRTTLNDSSSEPRNVELSVMNDTSIVVMWDEPSNPHGIISDYEIYYQADKGSDYTGSYIDSEQTVRIPVDTRYVLQGLYGSAKYTVSVAAVNGAGVGSRSTSQTVNTGTAAPPEIQPPEQGDPLLNTRQFELILQRPSTINGPISHYHVVVVAVPDGIVPSDSPDVAFPSIDSFTDYDTLLNSVVSITAPEAYIAAEFTDDEFPEDNKYIIGNENLENPDNDGYTNGELKYATSFTFFLRAYPFDTTSEAKRSLSARVVEGRQYVKFSSSGYTEVYATGEKPSSAGVVAGVVVTLLLVLIAAGIAIAIVIVVVYRRKYKMDILEFQNSPTKGGHELRSDLSITSDLSLTPIPSVQTSGYHDQSADADGINQFIAGHPSIPAGEFGKIVDRLHANDNFMFSQEYDEICTKSPHPAVDVCLNPANKSLNRYANIQAYDHSRVKLIPVEGYPHDYINANFLHGYNRENEYIATQGPLPDTVGDFWRMVWDHNTPTIVMLTNLVEKMRVKCSQYWPEGVGLTEQYANIRVSLTKCVTHADYCVRTFEIQSIDSKEMRQVKQFHYVSWPDFGVPRHSTPLLQFLRVVRRNHKYSDARPMIVHCSAGVGRTGTFVTIDSEMQRAKHDGVLNPYSFVRSMRNNRNLMVQTEAQYMFLHDALLEVITTGWTDIGVEQLADRMAELEEEDDQGMTGYANEFNRLKSSQQFVSEYGAAMNDANKFKNKIINALPYDHNRVKLKVIPGEPGSDYINASYIDGYKTKNVFIATQGPMENTVEDFWRMLWEQESSIIVMLCNIEERGRPICYQYLPFHAGGRIQIGRFHLLCNQELNMEDYTRREIQITNADIEEKNTRVVHHYQYKTWPKSGAPSTGAGMIDMMDQVTRSQHQTGNTKPVIVHCSAGVGRTGTFCALHISIERVKAEQLFNLFDSVKHLRTQRAHMVQTLDQYMFCYRTILEYVESLSNYANFQTSI